MSIDKEWIVVGIITSPQGINGRIKVKSFSEFSERFTKPGFRWLQKEQEEPKQCELISGYQKPGKELFILNIKDINNRDDAEKLKGLKLLVKSNDLPKLKPEEFHLNQLLDLKVKIIENNQSTQIGIVCDFMTEKNNLIVIKLHKNNKKVLIPFVKDIIPVIDLKNKYILVTPPPGLLDL